MEPLRKKARILAVVCVILLYIFYSTFGKHGHTSLAHNVSKKRLLDRALTQHKNYKENGLNFQTVKSTRLPLLSRLHEQLNEQFPYQPEKGYQKNIWQTWKIGLEDPSFPNMYKHLQATWDTNNPGYKHFVIADKQCDSMIQQLYAKVPDVAEAWTSMPKSILKADFFRYLILYARGGVYSDIDTTSLQPVDTWVSNNATLYDLPNNSGLVVGIEADPDRPDWAEWYARRIQFCQWTIQAKKGHPMLRELIAKITQITLERKKNDQLQKVLGKDQGGDIMNWTGPGIFTDMVFLYMNSIMQSEDRLEQPTNSHEEIVTWHLFTGMRVPLVLEDVLVLPITCFSPGVGQMGAGGPNDKWAYVQHMFLGSWKDDKPKPRERHPNIH